MEINGYTFAY